MSEVSYAAKEIRFTLLAVIKSRGIQSEHNIRSLKKDKGHILTALATAEGASFDQSQYPDFNECVNLLFIRPYSLTVLGWTLSSQTLPRRL